MIGPLYQKLLSEQDRIQEWIEQRFSGLEAPIYSSADLRYSGEKLSVIDTNLFPAGFNNLCNSFLRQASHNFEQTLAHYGLERPLIAILPEAHTRNPYYWDNIAAIQKIIEAAGAQSCIATYSEIGIELPDQVLKSDESALPVLPAERRGDVLWVGDQQPDFVLLNNDFSHGFPDLLCGLDQPVLPSPALGWHQRRKSDHFRIYAQLIAELALIIDIDPWRFTPMMSTAENINIHEEDSQQRLKTEVDALLEQIRAKHREHNISAEPYVFIKDNSGTYGMGIMHVTSGEQVIDLGRKKRNKLIAGKGRPEVSDYMIQEGIPTVQSYEGNPLEPVVYLVSGQVVGQFFRIHASKSERDSLNSKGMRFGCLCSHKIKVDSEMMPVDCDSPDDVRTVNGMIARIASYAMSLELEEIKSKLKEPGTTLRGCQ